MTFEWLIFFCFLFSCIALCFCGYLNYLNEKEEIRLHYLDPNNQEE